MSYLFSGIRMVYRLRYKTLTLFLWTYDGDALSAIHN